MKTFGKFSSFIIFLAVLMSFFGNIEAATVTCVPPYGFLPCTSGLWGRLFLIMVYQYLMSLGQGYISNGSDKFFSLVGPGIFGAGLFHILANFPMLFLILGKCNFFSFSVCPIKKFLILDTTYLHYYMMLTCNTIFLE
ncbi:hypothetical protein HanHA89_Chr04g0156791 [Helianthus annuus]|nr:hypothetical protein HanHA89_Chr04g0156791 [Helianthus annuus]